MIIAPKELVGKRVLIVEDEMLIALMIEDLLTDLGCDTVGPCGTIDKAMAAAETERLDLAVLDVNLAGDMVYPVADVLERRQVPFLFVSGYGDDAIPSDRATWRVCAKPFKSNDLLAMMTAVLTASVN